MQTPFDNPAVPTPGASGDHSGTRGGFDLPGGAKETPGTVPNQPTITSYPGDSPPGEASVESYMANRVWPGGKAPYSGS